jgi:hypothetical protein
VSIELDIEQHARRYCINPVSILSPLSLIICPSPYIVMVNSPSSLELFSCVWFRDRTRRYSYTCAVYLHCLGLVNTHATLSVPLSSCILHKLASVTVINSCWYCSSEESMIVVLLRLHRCIRCGITIAKPLPPIVSNVSFNFSSSLSPKPINQYILNSARNVRI